MSSLEARVLVLVLLLLVFVPAFLIRLEPMTGESFVYDSITSEQAASKGFVANALDRSGVLWERRGHPPLLSYVILLNNRVFGADEFGARVFSMLAGALGCLAASLSILRILRGFKWRVAAALLGGWMLCLLPVHLYVSRTVDWDALYSLMALCSLMCLSLYLARRSSGSLLAAGGFSVLAYLTSEAGILLVPPFAFALLLDLRTRQRRTVAREWGIVAAFALVLFAALWPGAIVRLSLARSILFRIRDNATSVRNLPWQSFYVELFRQSPAFTIAAVLGLAALAYHLRAALKAAPEVRSRLLGVYMMIVPFAVYVVVAFAASGLNRLVYVHHIVDMMAPLAVLLSCAAAVSAALAGRVARVAVIAACALLLAGAVPSALVHDPDIVGPQEHPGFCGVRDFLEQHPGARTYYYYRIHMSYYLPGARIDGDQSRYWTAENLEHVMRGGYDYVVTDWSQFDAACPSVERLMDELKPSFKLVHVVYHRRTGAPVAWIFSRSEPAPSDALK